VKIRVQLRKGQEPGAKVFVLVDARALDSRFLFENASMASVPDKDQPVSPSLPYLTYHAIEAAFQSGAFYARHRARVNGLAVGLLSFGWEGPVENAVPFAVATTVAIYEAVAGIRDYTATDLSGWEVVSVEPQ